MNKQQLPIGTERRINSYQQAKFTGSSEKAARLIDIHRATLDYYIERGTPLRVLDIGGGSGFEAAEVYEYCKNKGCAVSCTVLDYTPYDTWDELSRGGIRFIEGSAFTLDEWFEPHSFDVIFCNCLIHHLVFSSLSATKRGQAAFLRSLQSILAAGGTVCVTECTIESYIGHWSNTLHFWLTSMQNPVLAKIFRAFGAKSAGTGVYFRNRRGWQSLFEQCGYTAICNTSQMSGTDFSGVKQKLAKALMFIKDHLCSVGFTLTVEKPS